MTYSHSGRLKGNGKPQSLHFSKPGVKQTKPSGSWWKRLWRKVRHA